MHTFRLERCAVAAFRPDLARRLMLKCVCVERVLYWVEMSTCKLVLWA